MIRYSVVIPVYNAAEFIENSMMSIINQSYKNIELLLINDESTDNSEEVIKDLMAKHPDFSITYKTVPHGGPSTARNKGIELATGDYICFLDSDDAYELDLFEKLSQIESDFDICYFGWKEVDESNNVLEVYTDTFKLINDMKTGTEVAKMKYNSELWLCNCNEIYRLKMLKENHIRYPEGIYSAEDTYFIYTALLTAKSVICLPENAFINVYRSNSLMHSSFSKNSLTEITSLKLLCEYANSNTEDQEIKNMMYSLYYYCHISLFKKISQDYKWTQYRPFITFYRNNVPNIDLNYDMELQFSRKKEYENIMFKNFKLLYFFATKIIYRLKGRK